MRGGETPRYGQPLALAHRLGQGLERELGVADQGVLGRDVLVQVLRVEGGVDVLLAVSRLGELRAEVRAREAAADAEDHVGVDDVLPGR